MKARSKAKHTSKHHAANAIQITRIVNGMHCASCNLLVRDIFTQTPGIELVEANGNTFVFKYDFKRALDDLGARLSNEGYSLSSQKKLNYKPILISLLIASILLYIFHEIQVPFTTQNTIVSIALLGLIASVSTCFALSGGLLLSATQNTPNPKIYTIQFILGRLVIFAIVGAILGLVGSFFLFSPSIQLVFSIIIALLMVVIGLQMLGILSPFSHSTSSPFSKWKQKIINAYSYQHFSPFLGGLTILLPCAFTQIAILAALESKNVAIGFFMMGAFALASSPTLYFAGRGSELISKRLKDVGVIFIGALILVFALFTLYNGYQVYTLTSQSEIGDFVNDARGEPGQLLIRHTSAQISADAQIISMNVNRLAYQPSEIRVKAGEQVVWNIDATNAIGCARIITVPALGLQERLSGLTQIVFTPLVTGRFPFSCTMGMAGPGVLIVD